MAEFAAGFLYNFYFIFNTAYILLSAFTSPLQRGILSRPRGEEDAVFPQVLLLGFPLRRFIIVGLIPATKTLQLL